MASSSKPGMGHGKGPLHVVEWTGNIEVLGCPLTVDDLALLCIEQAGTCRLRDFGPRKLKRGREKIFQRGHARTNINRMMERIKRMFNRGVSEERVPSEVASALATVKGLGEGRSEARKSEGVGPVP